MRVVVASGKGGTGKTTVTVNLAVTAARAGLSAVYADADVEEPNGHLFLKPEIRSEKDVTRLIPVVDQEACTGCGKCGELCRYGAIAWMGKKVVTFPELCHSCGGCALVCPADAIREEPRRIGKVRTGAGCGVEFVDGVVNVGEAMSPPVIEAVKEALPDEDLVLIDAPPGTSCPAVEALRDADYVLLVAEPTPFGLNDLALVVDLVKLMGLRAGVVINRAGVANIGVKEWCGSRGLPVLLEIEESRAVAELISRGGLLVDEVPRLNHAFSRLLAGLQNAAPRVVL